MRCTTAVRKAGYFGKEADAGYRLCEQALYADPNNVRALTNLARKFYLPVMLNRTANSPADLKRADELASRALAVDANSGAAHYAKGEVLRAAPGTQGPRDASTMRLPNTNARSPWTLTMQTRLRP